MTIIEDALEASYLAVEKNPGKTSYSVVSEGWHVAEAFTSCNRHPAGMYTYTSGAVEWTRGEWAVIYLLLAQMPSVGAS